jgi:hypothetical protein
VKAVTLDEIKNLPREFLRPTDIAPILGCTPYSINVQAQKDPSKLGFPVIVIGSRVKIPKLAFIKFMKGEMQSCQEPK